MKKFFEVLRENLVIIIIFSLFLFVETFELDYSVYSPGGLINVDQRIDNRPYNSKGSFNLTYVAYRKGTLANLLIAKILPTHDIVKNDDITYSNEDIIDMNKRDAIAIKEAVSNATYIAYKYANAKLTVVDENLYIYFVSPLADTELKVGDQVIKCDDKDINTLEEMTQCTSSKNVGDTVKMQVIRNNKLIDVDSKIIDFEGTNIVGLIVTRILDYEKDPNLEYQYSSSEGGSSGGLLLSLSLYNSLIEEDITKGRKIAGTGTIELDGTVGEISGIQYKLAGAAKNKVDLFIVPEGNYEEAENVIKEKHYNIKLLKASTFEQVINDLKN